MLKQHKAEDDLIKVYGRLIAIGVLLLILTILGFKHFNQMPDMASKSLAIEHNRLLHIMAMIKSQWLSRGRPEQLLLSWESMAPNMHVETVMQQNTVNMAKNVKNQAAVSADVNVTDTGNWITLSKQGWPLLASLDEHGCQLLWYQLLATPLDNITVSFDSDEHICRFVAKDSASLAYQVNSGRVLFMSTIDTKVN
ncbi:hypothetical protein [Shewanella gaetbuli]